MYIYIPGQVLWVKETHSYAFHVAGSKLLESFFSKAMHKLKEEGQTASSKHLLLDLAHCFAPYLSLESLGALFDHLTPLLDVSCLTCVYTVLPCVYIKVRIL